MYERCLKKTGSVCDLETSSVRKTIWETIGKIRCRQQLIYELELKWHIKMK